MSEESKQEKVKKIISHTNRIITRTMSLERLSEETEFPYQFFREIIDGEAHLISHATLDKMLVVLENY